MAEKQSLNATFFAFRKREKSGVLLTTTLAYIAICIVSFGLFVALNFAAVADYASWYVGIIQSSSTGVVDESMITPPASVIALGPLMFLFQIFYYVIMAAFEAACLRWMIKGEQKGFFGFSFGADTWRVYLTYWIWFFLALAMGAVFLIIFGGMLGSMFALGAAGGDPSALGGAALALPFVFLALFVVFGWLCVRLAPAAATSIARNRFAFFDAWKVTGGRFWALLGSFVLLFVMYFVATMIVYGVGGFAFAMGLAGQAAQLGDNPSSGELLAVVMQPTVIIPVTLISILAIVGSFVWMIAMFGINARAAALALEEGKISAEA